MPRGYLFAFMRSEAAFRMLRSISVGSKLQDHHYAFLSDLPIPCAPADVQQAIHEMVVGAYEKREKGVALYAKALTEVEKALQGAI
jgi:type I restriction enzyme S subunit